MDVNRINSQSHSYFKYVVALSAVTTVALSIFRYTKPDTLSWRWPVGFGAATLILGLAPSSPVEAKKPEQKFDEKAECEKALVGLTEQLKTLKWSLEQFQEQLNQVNQLFGNAKTLKEVSAVDYNEELLNTCRKLDFNELSYPDNDLFESYLQYMDHLAYQKMEPTIRKNLEKEKVDSAEFQKKLATANELFRNAKTFSDFLNVKYSKDLEKTCTTIKNNREIRNLRAHNEFRANTHVQQLFQDNPPKYIDCVKALRKACEIDFNGLLEKLLNTNSGKFSIFTDFLKWSEIDGNRMSRLQDSDRWNDLLECVKKLDLKTNYHKFKEQED